MRAATDTRRSRALQLLRTPRLHEYVLLAVLLYATDHYRWLMDDAFVYFRYADNLLFLGRGLVYNPGEYVEGYSSPFWMLLLLPLRALQVDWYVLTRLLAGACALSYGVALIWLNRQLSAAGEGGARPIVNFPLAASAAHYGITTHFSSGLETPLVQLLAPLYAAAVLRPRSLVLQLAVALAPLVRAECALLAVAFGLWSMVVLRRLPWRFAALTLGANLSWLAFRVVYYADFLPNTFYLKDGTNWQQGVFYWKNVSATHHWPLVLALLAVCAIIGSKQLWRQSGSLEPRALWGSGVLVRLAMLLPAVLYGLYVARIGGDMLYHRYAALPVCLGLCASAGVLEAALVAIFARSAARNGRVRVSSLALRVGEAVVALAIAGAFGLGYPRQLSTHPYWLGAGSRKWEAIADPNWHRQHVSLVYADRRAAEDREQRERYARLRAAPAGDVHPKLTVQGFCQSAYRKFDFIVIHDYGLTEPILAHLRRPFGRPGHKLVQNEASEMAVLRERAAKAVPPVAWYSLSKVPRWVRRNRPQIELLERKVHNRHAPLENLRLAMTRVTPLR